jgi:hypothetical protein
VQDECLQWQLWQEKRIYNEGKSALRPLVLWLLNLQLELGLIFISGVQESECLQWQLWQEKKIYNEGKSALRPLVLWLLNLQLELGLIFISGVQDSECLQWQLWQEKLICLFTNGTVVVYSLLTSPPLPMYRYCTNCTESEFIS